MSKRIIIAGGGTGGHLFPGIALAKALKEQNPNIKIAFIGTERGIEFKVLPREGFPLKTISSSGLVGKRGLQKVVSWMKLPLSVIQSLGHLLRYRPHLVVGVGGYSSGPVGLSAWLLGIPVLIHEQNSVPGMTNQWIGKLARKVAVSFGESKKYFPEHKVEVTGNMIRKEFCESKIEENTKSEKFSILIVGGSQGAHSINNAVVEALDLLDDYKDRIEWIHQTGEKDEERVKTAYLNKGVHAQVQSFFFDMVDQVKKASLLICRSGAGTLAEIAACGKASILVPFPYAAHDHQVHNARAVETAGAARVVLDHELSGSILADLIKEAINDPESLNTMERDSLALGKRDATQKVMAMCMDLIGLGQNQSANGGRLNRNNELLCF